MEDLIRTYGTDVLRTAYLYVGDYHMAEDLFQEVFIKVNQKIHTFQGESSIKTWIIRITINTCKDYLKSAYYRRVVPFIDLTEDARESENDFEKIENQDRDRIIREAVWNLPLKYRDIFLCVYFQELSLIETAKVLRIPEGTVKSRLKRGRDKLKKILEGRV